MTSKAARSTLALDDPPPTVFDVEVMFIPPTTPGGTDYAFRFFGLTAPNNANVQTPQADFTLTLSVNGPGTVAFTADPIVWLPPGDQTEPIDRPSYITEPIATGSNQLAFTDFNPVDPEAAMILVSFVVNVSYQPDSNDDSPRRLSSEGIAFFENNTFTSHDPTIINVDPTGSGKPTSAGA
jgi:hypothetical protein